MPTHTATLTRYATALALSLGATVAFAMNPVLLKRQIEAGDAGAGSNSYVRLITAEDWSVNQEENRLEAVIEIPAGASIEGSLQGRLSRGCNFSANRAKVVEMPDGELRFRGQAGGQRLAMHLYARPISYCSARSLRFYLVGKEKNP